ncbi:MAG TPA: hypothetical protein DCP67_01490 [Planctomycetaceae bacterium]|nr:hypothetical protein [Planctomycetaceae bacterium]
MTFRRILIALAISTAISSTAKSKDVQYNRDVLPILSANCFACHGADRVTRQADLRLDQAESAFANRDGITAIRPGKPKQSEVVTRIFSNNPDNQMPPPDHNQQLTNAERQILKSWIERGARYEKHWAFVAPISPAVPKSRWGTNEIDSFVFTRLKQENLRPQPRATREQLIRRASIDITGLPPTLDQVDRFLADESSDAFEDIVDELLDSPRYGERMANWWLDGAHYGDSHGYDNDLENTQWPWRNWVIEAFNSNMPFNDFTIEQLAGDLLPDPTESQILATAFNRNNRIQTEDGAIDEEWRTEYVIDRVETMGAVWMGLTLGCCRCHDHKYDPISQQEFYQLFALFNNLDEKGFINNLRGAAEPRIRYKQSLYDQQLQDIQKRLPDNDDRKQKITELDTEHPFVMIMRDMDAPRTARILTRGQYDAPSEEVQPGLPSVLPGITEDAPVNRLAMARWLVNGRHPLTARVFVNRIWEQLFGTGLVKTSENLGVQSDWPSHPKLLDWLAIGFAENGWNIKQLIKTIILSETYQQDNRVDTLRLQRDPENRLLSRGPRVRLSAEAIRDQALFVSGLLNDQLGGPSIHPYQPAGLWEEVEKRGTYQQDHGNALYRRSLYITIRKTVPPPEMVIFDLPSREVCNTKRTHTNTPLQALALQNNITYVEASRKLAERVLLQSSHTEARIKLAFRMATQRHATATELNLLIRGYHRRLSFFKEFPDEAASFLEVGESTINPDVDRSELAAMSTVASILLNLDETLYR